MMVKTASMGGSCAMLNYFPGRPIATTLGPWVLGSLCPLEDSWQGIADFQAPMAMGPMVGGTDAGAVPLAGFGAGCLNANS